jgi:PKD repeat protein
MPIIRVPHLIIAPEPEISKVLPVADFSTNATSGYAPLSVQFTDLSQNAASRSWDFNSDGTVDSSDANPVYTYTTPGTYTANLTVSNANGTAFKTAPITVLKVTSSSGGSSGRSSHSGGESCSPVVISSTVNGSTSKTNATGTVTNPEHDTLSVEQKNTTAVDVEKTPEQKNNISVPAKESRRTPGFGIIFGIAGLLSVFLYKRK